MSSSSPSPMLPAKRVLRSNWLDNQSSQSSSSLMLPAKRVLRSNCLDNRSSQSSPSPMLPAKRLLRSNCLDNQGSQSKIRKLSDIRHSPLTCGRHAQNKDMLKSSQTETDGDMAALKVTTPLSADSNNLHGNEASTEHKRNEDVEKSVANDCARFQEIELNCKPEKIHQITSKIKIRELLDLFEKYAAGNLKKVPALNPEQLTETEKIQGKRVADDILANFVPVQNSKDLSTGKAKADDKNLFKLVVEKVDSGFKINWEDDDGEIAILSPAVWNALQLHSNHNNDEVKVTTGKTESKPENWSEKENVVNSEEAKIADFVNLDSSDDAKSDQQFVEDSDCEIIEVVSQPKLGHDVSTEKLREDANLVESSRNDDPICNNDQNLINRVIVQRNHPEAVKAKETLKLFEKYYAELSHSSGKLKRKGTARAIISKAASRLKVEKKWISNEKPFGHIPGVEIGDKFRFRAELAIVGLHCQMVRVIDYVKLDGEIYATSVVDSGRYENEAKMKDVLIYSGQGGNSDLFHSEKSSDQKFEKGNLALANSKKRGYPVRVTFKKSMKPNTVGMGCDEYVYDGLYTVGKYWKERTSNRKMVYKFELHRIPKQSRPREVKCKEVCILDDISNGLEAVKIRVINDVDDNRPLPFTYMTKMVYPDCSKPKNPIGCYCVDGCSDLHPCRCVKMNGVEIPFNEKGSIIIKKPIVHECGPQCKCPPTCMNRVSQLGLKYPLEIFKTKSMGWGVRSRDPISSGRFICEYVGELLGDRDADERICGDEYLFDIYNDDVNRDGYAIDALKKGNIGRFLNHSCNPNLYAQEVLYDHNDKRMPHIMFFAAKSIRALQELTYDYNYQLDHVRDKNGNIKTKDCHCGSRKCTGRMY